MSKELFRDEIKPVKTYTAVEMENLLRIRYCDPEWALIPKICNGAGHSYSRIADAMAINLYPSRGLPIHGFEIKVSRSDWLRELKAPDKAEETARYCDYWWVMAPKDVVELAELPRGWGLIIPHGSGTKIVHQAEPLKPLAVDRVFVVTLIRALYRYKSPDAQIAEARKMGISEGEERAKDSFAFEHDKHKMLQEKVNDFERASGIDINDWRKTPQQIGAAVRFILNGGTAKLKEEMKEILNKSECLSGIIKRHINDLEVKDDNPSRDS